MAAALQKLAAQADPGVLDEMHTIAFVDVFLRVKAFILRAKPMAIRKWMIIPLLAVSLNIAQSESCLRNSARPI